MIYLSAIAALLVLSAILAVISIKKTAKNSRKAFWIIFGIVFISTSLIPIEYSKIGIVRVIHSYLILGAGIVAPFEQVDSHVGFPFLTYAFVHTSISIFTAFIGAHVFWRLNTKSEQAVQGNTH
ncbi:hypothetical protein FEM03_00300 [Phragmitibacter flavus]|uniref:Uncharacterized protein n=1 Tax=Phragmitibacter flavus TaxID=2576071 RepID=A0A5R8KJX6_9BACT|nr:hypothetical protein [Phragmitibacter flavus]TLD72551.1 hypothetical protein FEM03_00300 [Phragmitibacter flavus]